MALGRYVYQDPVSGALSEVNQSLRQASSDVLSRRQLDLQNQQLLNQAAREQHLAELSQLATRGKGEVELLRTRGSLRLAELGEERAGRADVRAGEAHGLSMRAGEQHLSQEAQMFPLKQEAVRANIAQSRASAAASGASAAESNVRRQVAQTQLDALRRPVDQQEIARIVGLVEASGGHRLAEVYMNLLNPEDIKTVADLQNLMEISRRFDPETMNEMDLNLLGQELTKAQQAARDSQDPSIAQHAVQLEAELTRRLQMKGRLKPSATTPKQALEQRVTDLSDLFNRAQFGRADWQEMAAATASIESAMTLGPSFGVEVGIPPALEQMWRPVVEQTLAAQGIDPRDEEGTPLVLREIFRLGKTYGTPQRMQEVLAAQRPAPATPTPATPPSEQTGRRLPPRQDAPRSGIERRPDLAQRATQAIQQVGREPTPDEIEALIRGYEAQERATTTGRRIPR